MTMSPSLPTNIDATYPDDASDPSRKAHQQAHDSIHALYDAAVVDDGTGAGQVVALRGVVHGSTAATARPSGAALVHWIGSVAPTNRATNDEWTDTANKLMKRWTGSAWDTLGRGVGWTKRDRPPFILAGNVQVLASPPTLAWSGPGGASPINSGSPTVLAYNTAAVSLRSGVYALINQFSTNYYQNQVNGGGTQNPGVVEFDYYGSDFAMPYRDAAGGGGNFRLWVDGQLYPTSAANVITPTGITPAGGSLFRMRVTFAAAALRRIKIEMHLADFGGLEIGPTDTVSPVAASPWKVAVLGHSYVQGANGVITLSTFVPTLAQQLGWEIANCGQGGTGISNPGSGSNAKYGDTTRSSKIATYAPDALVIFGTRNDDAYTASFAADCAAMLATYAAIVPASRTFFVGGEASGSGATYNPAARATNAAAAATAAAAAGVAYIDASAWFTGTGRSNATAGDGNADVFTSSDAVHPTQTGHDYLGRRVAAAVASALAA